MNRRNFLGLIAVAPVALAALPAEVPLAKVIDDGINPEWDGTFNGVSLMESTARGYSDFRFVQYLGKAPAESGQLMFWKD